MIRVLLAEDMHMIRGALVALLASGIAMIPSNRVHDEETPRQLGSHDGIAPETASGEVRS